MSNNTETTKPAEQPTPSNEPTKKPANKSLLIIVAVTVLLLSGGGVFFYLQKVKANDENAAVETNKKDKDSKTSKSKAKEEKDDDDEDDEELEEMIATNSEEKSKKPKSLALLLPKDKDVKQVIEIQPFILNLADVEESRYLRLAVSIGIGGETESKPEPLFTARLRNALLAVLMTKTSQEVLSIEGKIALRKELLKAAQRVIKEPEIETIYITELIVQK